MSILVANFLFGVGLTPSSGVRGERAAPLRKKGEGRLILSVIRFIISGDQKLPDYFNRLVLFLHCFSVNNFDF